MGFTRHWVCFLTNVGCAHTCPHAHSLCPSPGPCSTPPARSGHLEHLPVHLRVGLHGVLGEHEGDEGKALGFLGQAVDGVMQLGQGPCGQASVSVLQAEMGCTLGTQQGTGYNGESAALLLWASLRKDVAGGGSEAASRGKRVLSQRFTSLPWEQRCWGWILPPPPTCAALGGYQPSGASVFSPVKWHLKSTLLIGQLGGPIA